MPARAAQPAGTRGTSRGAYEAALQPARDPASRWRVRLHLRAGGCDLRDLDRDGQEPGQSCTHAARGAARPRQRQQVRSGPHDANCFDHGRTGLIGRRTFADEFSYERSRQGRRSRRGRQLRRLPLEPRDVQRASFGSDLPSTRGPDRFNYAMPKRQPFMEGHTVRTVGHHVMTAAVRLWGATRLWSATGRGRAIKRTE